MPVMTCQHCGVTFMAKVGRIKTGRAKFCSRECAAASRRIRREVTCAWCNKVVTQRRPMQKYCSRTCSAAAAHAATGKETEKRLCGQCRRPFTPKHNEDEYCSRRCKNMNSCVGGGFGLFEDPWTTGAIQPDRYGRDLYRAPDIWLGF